MSNGYIHMRHSFDGVVGDLTEKRGRKERKGKERKEDVGKEYQGAIGNGGH